MADLDQTEEPATPAASLSLGARVRRELVEHRMAYIVLVIFIAGGTVVLPAIFPDAGPVKGALGGFFLGIWAALAAVGGKFIDD